MDTSEVKLKIFEFIIVIFIYAKSVSVIHFPSAFLGHQTDLHMTSNTAAENIEGQLHCDLEPISSVLVPGAF